MGSINRFNLNKIIKEFNASYFFETGTGLGEGVAHAVKSPFKKIISTEIVPQLAKKASKKFISFENVNILESNSIKALTEELPKLDHNCVFWLDAHFPGADAGLTEYDATGDESIRLPLEREINLIKKIRIGFDDVFIIDDLRIYENGLYQHGNAPADTRPRYNRNIDFIYQQFSQSHLITKLYLDEGYLLLFPRTIYKKNKKMGVGVNFKRKPSVANHYIVKTERNNIY
jgi:hypothetical protein